jgi:macrolide-specific efflux system membrane fusion protein
MTVEQTEISDSPVSSGSTRRNWLLAALVLLIALGIGFLLWSPPSKSAPPTPTPPPPKLKTVSVQRGTIEQTVLATGKLQLHKFADVSAQVSGQIKEVLVAIGDEVASGDLLLDITPTVSSARLESNQAQLARLQAELADQRAQLDFAESQFKRQTQLKADNATREESYEASRASMYSAAARVEVINAQMRQTESAIKDDEETRKHTQIPAPISGTVVALSARPGQMVNAAQQTSALLRIADLSKLTVQARVGEIDVPRLRKGMMAYFTTPGYPGKRWSGKLRQVIPVPADMSGEQGKQTFYNVLFEVNNPERQLMSGMSAEVSFVLAHARDAVLLPTELLGKPDADGSYSVNVVDAADHVSPRKVRVGIRNEQQAQVLSGLEPGEQVVVDWTTQAVAQKPSTPAAPAVAQAARSR